MDNSLLDLQELVVRMDDGVKGSTDKVLMSGRNDVRYTVP